jgi:hypothetical protein
MSRGRVGAKQTNDLPGAMTGMSRVVARAMRMNEIATGTAIAIGHVPVTATTIIRVALDAAMTTITRAAVTTRTTTAIDRAVAVRREAIARP